MLVERLNYCPILSTENDITKSLLFEETTKENAAKNCKGGGRGERYHRGVYCSLLMRIYVIFMDFVTSVVCISFLKFVIFCDFFSF